MYVLPSSPFARSASTILRDLAVDLGQRLERAAGCASRSAPRAADTERRAVAQEARLVGEVGLVEGRRARRLHVRAQAAASRGAGVLGACGALKPR